MVFVNVFFSVNKRDETKRMKRTKRIYYIMPEISGKVVLNKFWPTIKKTGKYNVRLFKHIILLQKTKVFDAGIVYYMETTQNLVFIINVQRSFTAKQ